MAKKTGVEGRSPSPAPTAMDQLAVDGRRFLRAFNHFIRIDISSILYSDDDPHRFLHFLSDEPNSVLKGLCNDVAKDHADLQLTLWPTLFALSESESRTSAGLGQDRGCFLIGVKASSDDDDMIFEDLTYTLSRFVEEVEESDVYADMKTAPLLSAVLVDRSKLGDLIVDTTMWPRQRCAPLTFSASNQYANSGYDFLADVPLSIPSEPTEETVLRPKLRPAQDVIDRLKWDPSKDAHDYSVVYLDRFTGFQELPLDRWSSESTDDEFVPQHRITAFVQRSTGEVVWHRELRIDKIFGTA